MMPAWFTSLTLTERALVLYVAGMIVFGLVEEFRIWRQRT